MADYPRMRAMDYLEIEVTREGGLVDAAFGVPKVTNFPVGWRIISAPAAYPGGRFRAPGSIPLLRQPGHRGFLAKSPVFRRPIGWVFRILGDQQKPGCGRRG